MNTFKTLPENTRKQLEVMGITETVYLEMFSLLEQVQQQMSGVTSSLSKLSNLETATKTSEDEGDSNTSDSE